MIEDPSFWVKKMDSHWDYEKHLAQRSERGFSDADWINFDTYIAWVIAEAVRKMKADGCSMFSFEGEPSDKWEELTYAEYDVMIKGFGNWADEKFNEPADHEAKLQLVADLDAALDIFKKRFKSLWD